MKGSEIIGRVRFLKDIVARASGHFVQLAAIGAENFSTSIVLEPNAHKKAGDIVEVPIEFLYPEMVMPLIEVGMTFPFHAIREIFAEVEVLEITEEGKRFQATEGEST
jgi:hypothetical protein